MFRKRRTLYFYRLLLCSFLFLKNWAQADGTEGKDSAAFSFEQFLLAPIRVHLLTAKNSAAIETTLTTIDLDRVLTKINRIWAAGGIQFYRESLVREEAIHQELGERVGKPGDLEILLELRPENTRAPRMFHLYYIKQMSANGVYLGEAMFVKNTASLREVAGGIDEPLPRVSSHELGHSLGLNHQTNEVQLMTRGTTGFQLQPEEIQHARAAASKLDWIEPAPTVLKRAQDLRAAGKDKEAMVWFERLSTVPTTEAPNSKIQAPGKLQDPRPKD
jgi:hypothetical protein